MKRSKINANACKKTRIFRRTEERNFDFSINRNFKNHKRTNQIPENY